MAVHCIEVWMAMPQFATYDEVKQYVEQKENQLDPVLDDENWKIHRVEASPHYNIPEHIHFQLRFDWKNDVKRQFLDPIRKKAEQVGADWAVIRYHECTHDEEDGECEWTYHRTLGTPPEEYQK